MIVVYGKSCSKGLLERIQPIIRRKFAFRLQKKRRLRGRVGIFTDQW